MDLSLERQNLKECCRFVEQFFTFLLVAGNAGFSNFLAFVALNHFYATRNMIPRTKSLKALEVLLNQRGGVLKKFKTHS